MRSVAAAAMLLLGAAIVAAQPAGKPLAASPLAAEIDARAAAIEAEMLTWRRHLHQHPELSNREVETAKFVAEKLRSFGLQPQTAVARHGVVAMIAGGKPGPVVAIRADMDGLPVTEETGLPFASKATGEYEGAQVGVMHACGHDTHMAMALAAAKILSELRDRLPGSVKLIFQPAEEGAPAAEGTAGAELMVQQGVMQNPKVDAVFGLHVFSGHATGTLGYRSGPMMAANDTLEIVVRGRQTHGARPWDGVDPIVVASQIVLGLQTIVSRQANITREPAIITIGQFDSGVRSNIIPDSARLIGTIRTFDDGMQEDIHWRVQRTAVSIAEAAGATAVVQIRKGYPVTANDPALTARALPTLERVAPQRVRVIDKITGAEDFTYYQRQAPGLFVILGITPPRDVATAPSNHSPKFFVDEAALLTGARALAHLAADYLHTR